MVRGINQLLPHAVNVLTRAMTVTHEEKSMTKPIQCFIEWRFPFIISLRISVVIMRLLKRTFISEASIKDKNTMLDENRCAV